MSLGRQYRVDKPSGQTGPTAVTSAAEPRTFLRVHKPLVTPTDRHQVYFPDGRFHCVARVGDYSRASEVRLLADARLPMAETIRYPVEYQVVLQSSLVGSDKF